MNTRLFSKKNFLQKTALLVIGCSYILYASVLLLRSSFLINGTKYFVLFDDMMISMRYAKNLAAGHGLVWNPAGERVEGFTNLLWALYMAFFHLLPIPQPLMSLPLQITGIILLIGTLYVVSRIAAFISNDNQFVVISSVILTGWYFPLNNWAVILGTEVGLLALILSFCVLLAVRSLKRKTFSLLLCFLLGFGTLVRLDMVVPAVAILLFLTIVERKYRKSYFTKGFGILALFLGGQTIWRYSYYHDLLPNTYYLKMIGYPLLYRVTRGVSVLWQFIIQMNWVLFFFPFMMLIKKRNKYILLLVIIFLAQISYSIYAGGDAWEHFGGSNRYISIAMPLFFVLYSYAFFQLIMFLLPKLSMTRSFLVSLLFICVSLLSFNASHLPYVLLAEIPLPTVGGNKINVERAKKIDDITTKNASVAVIWAGTMPYFSERTFIDLYGKNDKVIAREPMQIYPKNQNPYLSFIPGHMKWDYEYSIGELAPDVVTQVFPYEHAKGVLEKQYQKVQFGEFFFFLKRGSKNIRFEKL